MLYNSISGRAAAPEGTIFCLISVIVRACVTRRRRPVCCTDDCNSRRIDNMTFIISCVPAAARMLQGGTVCFISLTLTSIHSCLS